MMDATDYTTVRLVSLPVTVRAVTIPSEDGFFNIYINSALNRAAQQAAYQHELRHILGDHFYNDDPVWKNENEANF
ncbi:MAG: hypothetical protein IJP03_05445 [Christensenellaceae bacterium]|nr:hypothetical protein [Christensenellaceae bacterium]